LRRPPTPGSGGAVVPYGYQQGFANAGGTEVASAQAVRGDVIQVTPAGSTDATAESMYNPADPSTKLHTAIIRQNLGGGNFAVIDSNWNNNQLVLRHNLNPYSWASGSVIKIWRLGSVSATATGFANDIAWQQGTTVYTFAGTGLSTVGQVGGIGVANWAGVGDYNRDGKDDIYLYYAGTDQSIYVLQSNGSTFSSIGRVRGPGIGQPSWAATGDFDGA
jgi:hypothetical protein